MKQLRFFRALLGVGLIWGAAWAAVMAIFAAVLWLTLLRHYATLTHLSFPTFVIGRAVFGFAIGLVAGIAFSCVLAISERRRTVGTLSMRRVAGWGAITCMALVALVLMLLPAKPTAPSMADLSMLTAIVGALGASSAVATLSVARRASISPGEDPARLAAT